MKQNFSQVQLKTNLFRLAVFGLLYSSHAPAPRKFSPGKPVPLVLSTAWLQVWDHIRGFQPSKAIKITRTKLVKQLIFSGPFWRETVFSEIYAGVNVNYLNGRCLRSSSLLHLLFQSYLSPMLRPFSRVSCILCHRICACPLCWFGFYLEWIMLSVL